MKFQYSRHSGYECSSKGDIRFSAFGAFLEDGRCIESWYQNSVKGYGPPGCSDWRLGKGRPPKVWMSRENLWNAYLALWKRWALANPHLMFELRCKVIEHGRTVRDSFASSEINQARALAQLLNEEDANYSNHSEI